jgi:hypothetical protein
MSAPAGEHAIATFHSTHAVLKAEKLLVQAGVPGVRLVPVPSQISSDCGVTVRFAASHAAQATALLRQIEDLEGVFVQDGSSWKPFVPA